MQFKAVVVDHKDRAPSVVVCADYAVEFIARKIELEPGDILHVVDAGQHWSARIVPTAAQADVDGHGAGLVVEA
jgi:hypothetical protein